MPDDLYPYWRVTQFCKTCSQFFDHRHNGSGLAGYCSNTKLVMDLAGSETLSPGLPIGLLFTE